MALFISGEQLEMPDPFRQHDDECERCSCVCREFRYIDGQMVCTNCYDEICMIALDKRWNAPLSPEEQVIYDAPEEAFCQTGWQVIIAAESTNRVVQAMKAHIAECALCASTMRPLLELRAPDAVCCEEKEVA
jgi:hypothetical protein